MKIAIEHNQVKRELVGTGFNLCGSKQDLLRIADQIRSQASEGFVYGWIPIRDSIPDEHFSGPNSKPLPWGNEGGEK